MKLHGKYQDGVIVPVEKLDLPEGADLEIDVRVVPQNDLDELENVSPASALAATLMKFAGKATGLPPDAAENHDHYLYGTPKREP